MSYWFVWTGNPNISLANAMNLWSKRKKNKFFPQSKYSITRALLKMRMSCILSDHLFDNNSHQSSFPRQALTEEERGIALSCSILHHLSETQWPAQQAVVLLERSLIAIMAARPAPFLGSASPLAASVYKGWSPPCWRVVADAAWRHVDPCPCLRRHGRRPGLTLLCDIISWLEHQVRS